MRAHQSTLLDLGTAYKQLNAPFGMLSKASLRFATTAIMSGTSTDDNRYTEADARLADWLGQRDDLATKMKSMIRAADDGDHAVDVGRAETLIGQAWHLISEVEDSTN